VGHAPSVLVLATSCISRAFQIMVVWQHARMSILAKPPISLPRGEVQQIPTAAPRTQSGRKLPKGYSVTKNSQLVEGAALCGPPSCGMQSY